MNVLVIAAVALFSAVVGIQIGVRITAHRYQRALHEIDLTGAKVRE